MPNKVTVRFRPAPGAAEKIKRSPQVEALLYRKAVMINGRAKLIFTSRVKHTHPVTLPPYATSFKIKKAAANKSGWIAFNDDPAAFWVEFGAYLHDKSGHPQILKYAPYRLGLDSLGNVGDD